MKTVKEFKNSGLEFIDGDTRTSWIENHGSVRMSGNLLPNYTRVDKDVIEQSITEFAWRTNTGEKPSFSGKVVVELRDGSEQCCLVDSFDWSIEEHLGDIIKWRPVISDAAKMEGKTNNPRVNERVDIPECKPEIKIINNTSDCDVTIGKPELEGFNSRCVMVDLKPIYTQAMNDAGELPPIGSEFMLAKKINCQRLDQFQGFECDVIGHCKNLDGEDVITFSHPTQGLACMRHLPEYIKPIDTRTDEEKKLAEWILVMSKADSTSIDEKAKATLKWLEVNGYRKP